MREVSHKHDMFHASARKSSSHTTETTIVLVDMFTCSFEASPAVVNFSKDAFEVIV